MALWLALVALPIAGFGLVALERWVSLNFPRTYSGMAFLPIGEPHRLELGREVRDRMRDEQSSTYRDPALGRPVAGSVPWPPAATAQGAKYYPLPGSSSVVQMPPRVVYGGSPGGVARIDARIDGEELELSARYAPLGLVPAVFASIILALVLLPKVAVFIIPALIAGAGLNVAWSHWRATRHVEWALEYVERHLRGLEIEAREAEARKSQAPRARVATDSETDAIETEEQALDEEVATAGADRTRSSSE
jgi:hypothetical protein